MAMRVCYCGHGKNVHGGSCYIGGCTCDGFSRDVSRDDLEKEGLIRLVFEYCRLRVAEFFKIKVIRARLIDDIKSRRELREP
jgi:hypothetical protein